MEKKEKPLDFATVARATFRCGCFAMQVAARTAKFALLEGIGGSGTIKDDETREYIEGHSKHLRNFTHPGYAIMRCGWEETKHLSILERLKTVTERMGAPEHNEDGTAAGTYGRNAYEASVWLNGQRED